MKLSQALSLNEIQELVGGKIVGNKDLKITGINEIHKVVEGDLTYVDFHKYYDFVLNSEASVILIDKEADAPEGKALIIVDDPFTAYNSLAHRFRPTQHCTNVISETAEIGEGTIIHSGSVIGNNVKIGKNCIIYPNVTVYDYSEIGDNTIIHSNTCIGSDAFYFKGRGTHYEKMHTIGRTIIGSDVEIGSNVTVASGVSGDTVIGDGTKLDSQIHIGHGVVIGKHCLLCAQVAIAGKCNIGDHVILYGKVGVSKAITIGDKAVILASSNVGDNLEGGKTYFGSPAQERRIAWREYAVYRKLPEIWEKVKKLD